MASLKKRGEFYYIQFYRSGKQRRISTETDVLQLAKEKLRQFETAEFRGIENPLPTRTPIADIVSEYVEHIRLIKTPKSAQTDCYYLRDVFGPVCPALEIVSRKPSKKAKKRPPKPGQDRRHVPQRIEAPSFEQITTADIATFISGQVRSRGLAPKTANRYREILVRLFNWATEQRGIRIYGDKNPAAPVEKYKENAPEIQFLTLPQIDEQLNALQDNFQMQAMVATLIYAGLRREELLWLTIDDVDFKSGAFGAIRIRAKTIDGEFWQPKTKLNRIVPISSKLRHHLEKYRPKITPGKWYFPSPQGKRWDCDNFSADLRAANDAANLSWSCLDYRHTFGSQLAMKGESLYKISKLMGNSPEICRRHYAALLPESLIDSVEFGSVSVKAAS